MRQQWLFALLFACLGITASAQDFLEPADLFSSKEDSYITLADGKELVGRIDDIDRKKGLIEEITIKPADGGKKVVLKPEQIKSMFLPQSGFDAITKADAKLRNVTKWDNDVSAHKSYVKEGYVYFETHEVLVKKKKIILCLQLLNPGFANKVKVFYDPYASESMSVGIGGMNLAGGDAKSYYVKYGDITAFKLYSKNFEEEFDNLFGKSCDAVNKKVGGKKPKWTAFAELLALYDANCK
jgi:hypothetical protein